MQLVQYRMYKIITMLFVTVGICTASLISHAEIYRWTDENGKIHFSDKPVGDKAKKLDIKEQSATPANTQTRDERKRKVDRYLRARQEESAEIDKQEKEKKRIKKKRKKNCITAKKEYKRTIEAGSVYTRNDEGDRVYLDKKQRKKAETEAKGWVDKWCK